MSLWSCGHKTADTSSHNSHCLVALAETSVMDDESAWLGLAWLGLAWLGLAWRGLAWHGLARLDLVWTGVI